MTTLDSVLEVLRGMRIMFSDEKELQDAVEKAMTTASIPHQREAILGPRDRIDFMADGGIGIECKIDHSRADLLRQLFRYSKQPQVRVLVVVLGKLRLSALPTEMNNIPIHVVNLVRAFV